MKKKVEFTSHRSKRTLVHLRSSILDTYSMQGRVGGQWHITEWYTSHFIHHLAISYQYRENQPHSLKMYIDIYIYVYKIYIIYNIFTIIYIYK